MITRVVGYILVVLSVVSVFESAREFLLWRSGERRFEEESILDRAFAFGGHTFTVADNQPVDSGYSETEYEGTIQLQMDGRDLGEPSQASVRRGRRDLGRYHTWVDAWQLRDLTTNRTTLWLVRRVHPLSERLTRYEVITVEQDGTHRTSTFRTWELGANYPLFRTTQFIRDGSAIPLSMLGAVIFPPLLLVFPCGTLVLGIILLRRTSRARAIAAAA